MKKALALEENPERFFQRRPDRQVRRIVRLENEVGADHADGLTPCLAHESRPGAKDTILFDQATPGFGLGVHPSGGKVYIVQARIEVRSRRIVITQHGKTELAEARRAARGILAEDIRREQRATTLREFADEHLRRCDSHWGPSGRKTVRI